MLEMDHGHLALSRNDKTRLVNFRATELDPRYAITPQKLAGVEDTVRHIPAGGCQMNYLRLSSQSYLAGLKAA